MPDSGDQSPAARGFVGLALGWVILDQVTKALVVASGPAPATLLTLVPGWFEITHSRNPGAAFGMLDQHAQSRWLLSLVAVAALSAVVVLRRRIWELPKPQRIGLALVTAGALGNLLDRLLRGGLVVDFIRVYLPTGRTQRYLWPDFNVADIGVTCGMLLYVAHTLYCDWRAEHAREAEAPS